MCPVISWWMQMFAYPFGLSTWAKRLSVSGLSWDFRNWEESNWEGYLEIKAYSGDELAYPLGWEEYHRKCYLHCLHFPGTVILLAALAAGSLVPAGLDRDFRVFNLKMDQRPIKIAPKKLAHLRNEKNAPSYRKIAFRLLWGDVSHIMIIVCYNFYLLSSFSYIRKQVSFCCKLHDE